MQLTLASSSVYSVNNPWIGAKPSALPHSKCTGAVVLALEAG